MIRKGVFYVKEIVSQPVVAGWVMILVSWNKATFNNAKFHPEFNDLDRSAALLT